MKRLLKKGLLTAALMMSIISPVMVKAEDKIDTKPTEGCLHEVNCLDESLTCVICGAELKENSNYSIIHNPMTMHDENKHWQECLDCGVYTMPKLDHYISCLDYTDHKDACTICGATGVKYKEGYVNLHSTLDVLKENKRGVLIHVRHCFECNKDVTDAANPAPHKANCTYKKTRYGTHKVICSCGYRFSDDEHHYGKLEVARKATFGKDGVLVRKCKECGAKKKYTINAIKRVKFDYEVHAAAGANAKNKRLGVIVLDTKRKIVSKKYYSLKYTTSKKTGRKYCIVTFKGRYKGVKRLKYPEAHIF